MIFNFQETTMLFLNPNIQLFFIVMAILYLPIIFSLQNYMRNRLPYNIKNLLFCWNIIASLLSGYGAYYVIKMLYYNVMRMGINKQVCDITQYNSYVGLIIFIFNVTKMLEWIDTLFLIFMKKKLIFLHWYHHIITMLYCWHSTIYSCSVDATGTWFAGMNLFVHFIMYGYYGLTSIGIRLANSFLITFLQFIQMVVGIFIIYKGYTICNWQNNFYGYLFAFVMYASYAFMFFQILAKKITEQLFKKND